MFNPYSAGNKIYGGGRSFPTMGKVDPLGYKERDLATKARRNALLRRLQAMQSGRYMSADYLRNR
jgi:hypothetical protein